METIIPRKQFTFYYSYWEALQKLTDRELACAARAICNYALDGVEPGRLPANAKMVFTLVRPTLDTGRRKAMAGHTGGILPGAQGVSGVCPGLLSKQTASNAQANHKQTTSKKEEEKEVETEAEIEYETE